MAVRQKSMCHYRCLIFMFIQTAMVGGCTILFVLNQVISRPRRMSSRPQEDVDSGLSVKKAKVPLPRLRGARPSTGLGSATTPAPLLVATSHLPATTWRKLHTPSMPSTPKLPSSKRTRWSGLVYSSEIYLDLVL